MENHDVSRRALLKGGGAALAGLIAPPASPIHAYSGQQDDIAREQPSDHTAGPYSLTAPVA